MFSSVPVKQKWFLKQDESENVTGSAWRETLLWALPAIILGVILRAWMLSYLPIAYWGPDSYSYFRFAQSVVEDGDWDFNEKRRWIYPIIMLGVYLLPGAKLLWVAWVQHLLALSAIIPVAYVIRKTFCFWRWLIIPTTLFFAALPCLLALSQQAIADSFLTTIVAWTWGGWVAWTTSSKKPNQKWWFFFLPLAIFTLSKPSMRFFWPGLLIGLLFWQGWKTLTWRQIASLGLLLLIAGLTMGSKRQSAFMLYSSLFPLTRLDTELHTNYKNEIREWVQEARAHLPHYYEVDQKYKRYVQYPEQQEGKPLWQSLGGKKNEEWKAKVYRDLSREAILSRPHWWLYISAQRILASARISLAMTPDDITGRYYANRFGEMYERLVIERPVLLRKLLGFPKGTPLPIYENIRAKFFGKLDSQPSQWLSAWNKWVAKNIVLVGWKPKIGFYPTFLSGWLIAALLFIWLKPYRHSLGWITVMSGSYLLGTFLVGGMAYRYFAPALPAIILLMALPIDALLCFVSKRFPNKK